MTSDADLYCEAVTLNQAAESFFLEPGRALLLLDDALTVRSALGAEAFGVRLGAPVIESFPALIGYERDLTRLRVGGDPLNLDPVAEVDAGSVEAYVTFTARRQPHGLTLFVEDASRSVEMMRCMVQQHNELSLAQQELKRARDAAQAANKAKDVFIAKVSHELRTPLSVIIGNAEILKKDRPRPLSPAEVADYAGDVHASGAFLLELVNDILDLSRAGAETDALEEEWCAPEELLTSALAIAGEAPIARDKHFYTEADPGLPRVWVDRRRMRQVLINLISNAVKFSEPDGEIRLFARQDLEGRLTLSVSDDGPGMTPADAVAALRPFAQAAAGKTREGVGLGLSIVESFLRLHGGDIALDTSPGAGLTAAATLPKFRCAAEG